MNYNRIKDEMIRQYGGVSQFFAREGKSLKMTEGGFYQTVRRESIKVRTLEIISSKVGRAMTFWFQDDISPELSNPKVLYGEDASIVIQRLNRQIDKLMNDVDKLEQENDSLKEKLNLSKAG
jgi:hypothetical protein